MKHFLYAMTLLLVVGATTFSTGCKKKDDKKSCPGFSTLSGSAEVNGEDALLVIAQSLINSSGSFDTYLVQLMAIEDDCNTTHTISFNIDIPVGTSLDGVYEFKSFFTANTGDAVGDYTVQILDPISQSAKGINSGSLTVDNKGGGNYDFDINGNLAGGGTVQMKVSAKL
jgi:hypothetical protein